VPSKTFYALQTTAMLPFEPTVSSTWRMASKTLPTSAVTFFNWQKFINKHYKVSSQN